MLIKQTGNGSKTVVGFHGWSGDHHTFDPLLDQIPEDYAFYALDLPGCGKSALPQEWEMRSLARDVAMELIGLNRKELTLVGSCSGAILTAFVARELIQMEKKDLVRRLVMIDPFAFCPWYFQLFLIPIVGPLMYATAFANPLGRGITNLFLRDKRARETHLTRDFAEVNHWVVWKYLKMLSECGGPDQFRGLDLPVDILYGEKTFSAVRKSVLEWSEALPQSRIAELKEVGHLPISEGTKEVAEVVFQGAKV
jgi:pimeloyl-ACP methyl ester carboxylesterase